MTRVRLAAALALGALLLLAPPSFAMQARTGEDEALSPRLAQLAKPSVRLTPPAKQAGRLSLAAEGPGSLLRVGNRVLADVRFEAGAAARTDALRGAGAQVIHVSRRYQTVTVAARPVELPALAEVAGVAGVTEVLTPIVSATECAGLTTSEGDAHLNASAARTGFALDGAGVTVGILSDSFDTDPGALTRATQDVVSGDLPGAANPCGRTAGVAVFEDFLDPGGTIDEGRAMAQIVHDLAPGASISFATAFKGELAFADNIRGLATAGAKVIVDDIIYLPAPFFQEGPIGVAATEVDAAGVAYFSSAGNNNLVGVGGDDIASWEAPEFRDTTCPPELVAGIYKPEVCMDFDPTEGVEDPTFGITVDGGETLTVVLQWAEPRFGVKADIDVFLLDEDDKPLEVGGEFVGSFDNNISEAVGSTERPVEVFGWENPSLEPVDVRLAINRCFSTEEEKEEEEETEVITGCNPWADSEAKPRLKFALLQNGGGVTATEFPKSQGGDIVGPTIFGHTGSPGAISVGAVRFNTFSAPEEFSSRGPVTHYFGPVSGSSPAAPLAQPLQIAKPDLAATDCGLTTFFLPTGIPGVNRFCGTSAAAPHAAAVAALMRQANPALSVPQMRTALAVSARPVGAFGPDAVGAGLVDAVGAVSRVAQPPQVGIDVPPQALSNNPRPNIAFSANRPVSFSCSFDGAPPTPCASPFAPQAPLPDGVHGFAVTGTDIAGRSGTSPVVAFTTDTRPPRTFFRARPRKVIRTNKRRVRAVFRFGSNERGAVFSCRVDRKPFRFCKRRFVRRYGVGRHVMRVRARDAAGNVDRTPAVYRFRVKRRGQAR